MGCRDASDTDSLAICEALDIVPKQNFQKANIPMITAMLPMKK